MDNKINFVRVTEEYSHLEEFFDIRDEAFPENERSKERDISEYTGNPKPTTFAVEDDGSLIGFTVLRHFFPKPKTMLNVLREPNSIPEII